MTAERVGALRYDVILNTSSLKKGAMDSRSALKTFRDSMKGATTDVERYQAGIKNLQKLRADGSITQDQGLTILKELNKDLDKAGYKKVAHNKFEKTHLKLLQEEGKQLAKNNAIKDQEQKNAQLAAKHETDRSIKRRHRSSADHREVIARQLQIQRANAKGHRLVMLNMRERMRTMGSFSPGMAAGVAGNLAGAMGASGATIGAVRGGAMLGAKMAVPVAGFIALGLAMKKAVAEADKLRKVTLDLSVLLGNSDAAAKNLVSRFQALARQTPLTTAQLAEGARQLLAFGRASRFIEDDLTRLGTIAGGDVERMRLLTKAFGDVVAAGKLQGQELRQFTNQGFNPLREMADMTGVSYGKLRKQMELGMISADMVSDSMSHAAERFAGRLEAAMDTVSAQYAKLKGILNEFWAEGGGPVQEVVVDALKLANAAALHAKRVVDFKINAMKKAGEFTVLAAEDVKNLLTGQVWDQHTDPFENINKAILGQIYGEKPNENKITKEQILEQQKLSGFNEDIQKLIEKRIELLADEDAKLLKLTRELNNYKEIEDSILVARGKLNEAMKHGGERGIKQAKENLDLVEQIKKKQDQQQELKDRRKREIEHENRLYKLGKKTIADIRKKKEESAKKEFKDAQTLAELARKAGGPSGDFTAAGTDYKFVQQRRGEIEAKRIEEQANKKRESSDEERNTLISKMLEMLELNHTDMLSKLEVVN